VSSADQSQPDSKWLMLSLLALHSVPKRKLLPPHSHQASDLKVVSHDALGMCYNQTQNSQNISKDTALRKLT